VLVAGEGHVARFKNKRERERELYKE